MRALVFDFDGLIVDTEGPAFSAWQEIYAHYGHELSLELWASAVGTVGGFDPVAYLEAVTGRKLNRQALRAHRLRRKLELSEVQGPRPGVEAYVGDARARGLALGIASSDTRAWVSSQLERVGLDGCFDSVRCADGDARISKPSPHLYEEVLADLGVAAHEAVAFEDSPNGITAAADAGLFCVAVPNPVTQNLDLSGADLVLSSLSEISLGSLLDRIGG